MIKADFHLRRDVHMCGQERSWQVFKKQQQYLSTSVGAALKWQKRPRKNIKNKKHMGQILQDGENVCFMSIFF